MMVLWVQNVVVMASGSDSRLPSVVPSGFIPYTFVDFRNYQRL